MAHIKETGDLLECRIESFTNFYTILYKYGFSYSCLYWPIYNYWYAQSESFDGQTICIDKFFNTKPQLNERYIKEFNNFILIYEKENAHISNELNIFIKFAAEKLIYKENLKLFAADAKNKIYKSSNTLLLKTLEIIRDKDDIPEIENSALQLSSTITNLLDLILDNRTNSKMQYFHLGSLINSIIKIVKNNSTFNYYIEEPIPEKINNNKKIIEEILMQLLNIQTSEIYLYIKSTPLDIKIEKFKYKISFFIQYTADSFLKAISLYHSDLLSKKINSEIYIDDDKTIIFNLFTN